MFRRVTRELLRLNTQQLHRINHELCQKTLNFQLNSSARNMSKMSQLPNVVDFQQVKTLKDDVFLIDVREPSELQQFGVLPKSVNIPLGQVESAFKELTNEEFKQTFGCTKPTSGDGVVFSCKAGIRSKKAMKIIESLGFTNTSIYLGGFDDWLEQSKK